MPLDPVATIIRFESTNCTNMQNPTSDASGCGGMIDSTWRSIAPTIGIDTAQYPHMKNAPITDQLAATAALYNARGFADYTCSRCDPAMTAYINSHGGSSAFQAPGTLSVDPAAYQSYLPYTSPLAGGGISPLTGSDSATAPISTTDTSSSAAFDFNPFSYTYSLYQTHIAVGLNNVISQARSQAAIPLDIAVLLVLVFSMFAMMYGQISGAEFRGRLWRITIVVLLLAPGSTWYQDFIVDLFLHAIPSWTAGIVSGGGNESGPVAAFGGAFFKVYSAAWSAAKSLSIASDGLALAIVAALFIMGSAIVINGVLVVLFAIFLTLLTIVAVLVCLGPFLSLLLLWSYTRHSFDLWVGALIGFSIAGLGINVLIALIAEILTTTIQSILANSSAGTATLRLVATAMVILILAFAAYHLKSALERIGGVSGVPSLSGAHQFLRRAVYSRIPGMARR